MSNTKQIVMDIAMNLHRIGNWAHDDFEKNKKKIDIFLDNTDGYISKINNLNPNFMRTWNRFINVYPSFKNNLKENAENLTTWGNILTHRSKLLEV